jgi:hypothetical protein
MTFDPTKIAADAIKPHIATLERIGGYVKDICELTVYMAEALFIKHSAEHEAVA